jgi:hypothetical protein
VDGYVWAINASTRVDMVGGKEAEKTVSKATYHGAVTRLRNAGSGLMRTLCYDIDLGPALG